ncbi:MAG TPA: GNAT family N-acetyltransferase [Candidatus Eremiobacteraceae bacterium]|jgi:GNAT superfamily N-acetyltransferase
MSTHRQERDAAKITIVPVTNPAEIEIGVRFRYAMKVELAMRINLLRADWAARETAYFARRTAEGGAQWYLAKAGEQSVGSACAYVDDSWASTLLEHPQNGWIIGVYVVPEYRRRGIARALTDAALGWLRSTECVEAKLHASPYGRGIYETLGFKLTNEMKLLLRPD